MRFAGQYKKGNGFGSNMFCLQKLIKMKKSIVDNLYYIMHQQVALTECPKGEAYLSLFFSVQFFLIICLSTNNIWHTMGNQLIYTILTHFY